MMGGDGIVTGSPVRVSNVITEALGLYLLRILPVYENIALLV
jgi:hypothetical protein